MAKKLAERMVVAGKAAVVGSPSSARQSQQSESDGG